MDNETLESNKLIADFMGYKWPSTDLYSDKEVKEITHSEIKKLNYHSSWDWLMPVIKKIENINHDSAVILEEQGKVLLLPIYSEINKVWCAVVEFIKWYNENR